jgi:hypothetical protein
MKKTVLRYGSYALITIVLFFIGTWIIFRDHDPNDFKIQEILGYSGIFLATIFAFFGIKYYRDHVNGGRLSFGEGLKTGFLIILFPALGFGLLDVLYVTAIDPGFYDNYYNQQVTQLRASLPANEFAVKQKEIEEQKALFQNPLVSFLLMFITVLAVGLIVSIISALILKSKTHRTGNLRTGTA